MNNFIVVYASGLSLCNWIVLPGTRRHPLKSLSWAHNLLHEKDGSLMTADLWTMMLFSVVEVL